MASVLWVTLPYTPVNSSSGFFFSFVRKKRPYVHIFSPTTRKQFLSFVEEIDSFLGIGLLQAPSIVIPSLVQRLVVKREALRKEKKWDKADEVRRQLFEMGWIVEDASSGTQLKPRESQSS